MVVARSSAADVLQSFDHYSSTDETFTYNFRPKFQKSTKNNPMSGICLFAWIEILSKRWRQIDYLTYWPRVLMISLLSIFNSLLAIVEHLLFESSIRQTTPNPRPVFILGHPRTGTTLLHSLVALDEGQFDVCTTFCAGFPSSFLWFEKFGKQLFKGILDETRPMDNVVLDFDLPQEDELATNLVSAGTSPYMPLFFMPQEAQFRPYYAFDDHASGDEKLQPEEMARARNRWVNTFYYLCQKLTLRSLRTKQAALRLVLKSPVHTARIPLLLRIFPDAQFIYIHRHPYHVFQSAAHMADTTYWYTYFSTPQHEEIQEFILRQYEILWDRYEEGRKILQQQMAKTDGGAKQLVEIAFDDLSQKPFETMDRIYNELGWDMSSEMKRSLEQTVSGDIKSYKRNKHETLDPKLRATLQERWGASFDRLGYKR
ncbi:unnamed protein product [Cylindrotheca closterium]|uniref:Uncharacterized protein n=1 Tax=Cylindrotheca closterium TaxID=2856 RepID=A0AAD2FYC2_9STRA|nr:unnamed protein product [Cylindrotheca closterium]